MQFADSLQLALGAGDAAATAAGMAGFMVFAAMSLAWGALLVVNTLVSQSIGAGNRDAAGRYLWQGVWFGVFAGVVLWPTRLISGHVFAAFGHSPEVVALAQQYYNIEIGWAPDRWDFAVGVLRGARIPMELGETAGMLMPRQTGGHYDRLRGRVVFPIRDARGRVLGFGGRAISKDQEPKYLNTPETPVFRKREALYGLPKALEPIRRSGAEVTTLRLAGGGSVDARWRQMLADALDVELHAVDCPDAAGRGAAILGGLASGHWHASDLASLAPATTRVASPRDDRALAARYARFLDLYARVEDWFPVSAVPD